VRLRKLDRVAQKAEAPAEATARSFDGEDSELDCNFSLQAVAGLVLPFGS
jgi:hypothetical protein